MRSSKIMLFLIGFVIAGCDDVSVEPDADPDGDADSDADTNADNDADTNSDADADETEPPLGVLGDACFMNAECESNFCIPEFLFTEITGGYCTETCELDDPHACGDRALCVFLGAGPPICMKQCEGEEDCRDDWDCAGVCLPGQDVAEVTPADLLDETDEIILGVVEAVDQERLREHIEILSGEVPWNSPEGPVTISSRSVYHPDHLVAERYLETIFTDLGLVVELQPFDWTAEEEGHSGSGVNIEARLVGVNPELEPIIITAHYDSTASFSDGWVAEVDSAPGATDNASGVSIVLELARILTELSGISPAPRTFVFLLVDGEEPGLFGSYEYVAEMEPADELLCALNIDMVAWNLDLWPGRYWYAFHPSYSDLAALDVEAIGEFVPGAQPIFSDAVDSLMFAGSDHLAFWDEDLCSTYFSNWPLTGVYHTYDDQIELYDWSIFMDVARSAAAVFAAWGYRW